MSLIFPAGLWALLALAIPILIHLFNRSRGRLVRIGHIDLVRQARRLRVTEVKLAQWLLLLLRMGIFTLAALILAGLAQPGLDSSGAATIYVTPAWIRTASEADLNELTTTRVLTLQPGFAALDLNTARDIRQTDVEVSNINNVWPLLAERLSLEHHSGAVTVYATDYSQQFGHSRVSLPRQVSWNISHPQAAPAFDDRPARVVVAYDQARRQDADFFRAALASLKATRLPGLKWQFINSAQITPEHLDADWLILLSKHSLSDAQLAQLKAHTTLLMDAPGELQDGELQSGGQLQREQYASLPFYPFSTFRLNGLTQSSADGQTVLASNDGRPALQMQSSQTARILQFNSRFNPQWSTITQLAEFPELLLQLMLNERQKAGLFADARINPQQLSRDTSITAADIPLPRHSLQNLLAMLLVLLWVLERWLSERQRSTKNSDGGRQ